MAAAVLARSRSFTSRYEQGIAHSTIVNWAHDETRSRYLTGALGARRALDLDSLAVADPGQRLRELIEGEERAQQGNGVDGTGRHQVGRRAEAVQDRHRPEDGDLVVVDAERGERHGRVAAGDSEDEQPAAPLK